METHDDTANSLPRPAGHAPRSNQVHGLAALLRGWWLRTEALDGRCKATVGGPGLLALCHALARAARRPMWVVDGVTCASMDALSRRLRTGWPPRRLVLVDGVVELCDVEAIERAIARGDSPFDAELRTLASFLRSPAARRGQLLAVLALLAAMGAESDAVRAARTHKPRGPLSPRPQPQR